MRWRKPPLPPYNKDSIKGNHLMNIYHFTSLESKDNWNHTNGYVIEGDYGNTITKELVETFHKNGEFAHQSLDELISGYIETDGDNGEDVEIYDWFNT